jgi:hypothetical protein
MITSLLQSKRRTRLRKMSRSVKSVKFKSGEENITDFFGYLTNFFGILTVVHKELRVG